MPLLLAADIRAGGNLMFIPTFASTASFPAAASSENSLAYATDANTVHYSNGSAWIQFAPLANDLAALENLSSNGIAVRTGTSAWTTRSVVSSANADSFAALTWTNGDGVSGNPSISVDTNSSTGKLSVEVATTANITLTGTQTIDGVAVVAGDRVLVKNQSTGSANGIYIVAAGAWTRATDFDSTGKAANGMFVYVQSGTVNGGKFFRMDNANPTIGTTSLTFSSFGGSLPITESDITDGSILARIGSDESITGNWDFTNGVGSLTVRDDLFWISDSADLTKSLQFELSSITSGVYRTLTVQNKNGTIALESWKTLNFPADTGFTWGSADVVSTLATDTLKIVAGNLITLNSDATSKAFRIGVSSTVPTASGGSTNKLAVWQSGTVISANVNFSCDNTNDRIGIGSGATSPVTRLHVAGSGGFGDTISAGNAIRALNLNSTDAVMRILRFSADSTTAAPGIEIMHRTVAGGADGSNTLYYDIYADSNGLKFRDRIGGDNVRLTIAPTTGMVSANFSWGLTNAVSPASIGANQNDYALGDSGGAAVARLTSSGAFNITGLAGGVAGRVLRIVNIGSNALTLKNEDAGSATANRFAIGADITLSAGNGVTLWYDNTSTRWRATSGSGGGAAGAPVGASYLTLGTDATLTSERVFTAGNNVVVTDGGAGGNYTVAVGTQTFTLNGIISPTGTTGTVNDYAPTSLSTSAIIRQTTTAATTITGLTGGSSGRMILFFNIGTHDIDFSNENSSSTAANRFAFGIDYRLAPNKSIMLWYDSTSSRWRAAGIEDDAATRVNIQAKTANYTLVLADAGKFITMDSTGNITLTIPTNATAAFPIGTVVSLARINTGKVNVAGAGGVTVNSADGDLYLRARYSGATCMKTAADVWLVTGDLTAT